LAVGREGMIGGPGPGKEKKEKEKENGFKFEIDTSNLLKHELKNFEIKYSCEGFDERSNFPYRNFLIFEMDFKLKFKEVSMS
jgi:hypothetical protein